MRHWTGAFLIVATLVVNGEVQGQHRPPTARLLPLDPARPTPVPETMWVHVRDADDRSATFQIVGFPGVHTFVGDDPRRWANLAAALRARPDRHPMTPGAVIARTATPDPATPSGVRISPSRRLVLDARQPRVTNVRPNFGPPGTLITLTTRDVPKGADTLQVRFLGHRHSVTAHRLDAVHFTVPARASFMPGPVAVETAYGDVIADPEDVGTWFLRTHVPISPTLGELTPLPGNATIRDVLTATDDVRRFAFAGVAGTVVSAHAFSVDPWTDHLTDPALDDRLPRLEMRLVQNPDGMVIRTSTMDGPGANPWLHLRLPRTGVYHLELALAEDTTAGRYLLNIEFSRASSVGEPPIVVQVAPQVGRPGDVIEITGAFFTPGSRILVAGVPTPARFVSSTRLQARIPCGTLPGPVQVQSRWGLSTYEPDDTACHLAVLPGDALRVAPGSLVNVGTVIANTLPAHGSMAFAVDLVAGENVAIAAWSVGPWGERIRGTATRPGGPDLALIVTGPSGSGVRVGDDSGGPGRNPAIGVSRAFPWEVPRSGRYTIAVEDLSPTGGPFILTLIDPARAGGSVPLLTVPLAIRVFVDPLTRVPALSRAALDAQLEHLEAWTQAGIWPHAATIEYITPSPDHFIINNHRELETVLKLYGAGTAAQDILVVGGLPRDIAGGSTLGVTWTPTGQVLLNGPELPTPGSSELAVTLAHEIGHILGRLHDLGAASHDNLMHDNLATQTGQRLDLDQINHARYLPAELRPTGTRILTQSILVIPCGR